MAVLSGMHRSARLCVRLCKWACPKITSAQSNQTNGSIVFARWRQSVFPWGHIGATWRIQLDLRIHRPTRVHNPSGKSRGGRYLDPSNTWFLGPTRVLNTNGNSITSAVTSVTDWQTDRQTDKPRYSVGNNRPHVRTHILRCGVIMRNLCGIWRSHTLVSCWYKLECGPMPNVMAALPNIGGALCSTPQSLADAHY